MKTVNTIDQRGWVTTDRGRTVIDHTLFGGLRQRARVDAEALHLHRHGQVNEKAGERKNIDIRKQFCY